MKKILNVAMSALLVALASCGGTTKEVVSITSEAENRPESFESDSAFP